MHEDCIYKEVCETECKNLCVRYSEMSYLLQMSNIPKTQQKIHKMYPDDCDLQSFEKLAEIQEDILNFVNNGEFLYIYSNQVGNGKTTWTIKLMLQYFNEIWAGNGFNQRGLFINVPVYISRAKEAISTPAKNFESMRKALPKVDLAIFDDVTVSKLSNYDYSLLLAPIDERIFNTKATIFTGNLTPNELSRFVGERVASRICSGSLIKLEGQDMRK